MRPRVLADFAGHWSLSREIRHAEGPPARFTGTALWQPDGADLLYVETGRLDIEGQGTFTAERRYRWAPGLMVYFDDGRFFHQVPADGGKARHWCDPDHYRVRYDFSAWPAFKTVWEVEGPRKSYRLHTAYDRM